MLILLLGMLRGPSSEFPALRTLTPRHLGTFITVYYGYHSWVASSFSFFTLLGISYPSPSTAYREYSLLSLLAGLTLDRRVSLTCSGTSGSFSCQPSCFPIRSSFADTYPQHPLVSLVSKTILVPLVFT